MQEYGTCTTEPVVAAMRATAWSGLAGRLDAPVSICHLVVLDDAAAGQPIA
jgi:hypothetical protein